MRFFPLVQCIPRNTKQPGITLKNSQLQVKCLKKTNRNLKFNLSFFVSPSVPVFRYRVLVHADIAIPHYLYQERIYIRATPIFGVTPAAQTPFNSSVVGFGQEILFEPLLKYEQLNLKNYVEADNVRFSSARSYVRQR